MEGAIADPFAAKEAIRAAAVGAGRSQIGAGPLQPWQLAGEPPQQIVAIIAQPGPARGATFNLGGLSVAHAHVYT